MRKVYSLSEQVKTIQWQVWLEHRIHVECGLAITEWYGKHPHKHPFKGGR